MNKNGWGLRAELMVILMFLMCLVISTIGLNKMGLIGGTGINTNYSNDNTEFTYINLEQKLNISAQNYIKGFYGESYVEDEQIVRYSTLFYKGYMLEFKDNNDRKCSGYVVVTREGSSLLYHPYIKCPGYKSNGYNYKKDY